METSLRFDSRTKHLCLFAKEKFSNDDNYVLTVRAPHALSRVPNARTRTLGPAKRVGLAPTTLATDVGFLPSDADAPSRRGEGTPRARTTHTLVLTHTC